MILHVIDAKYIDGYKIKVFFNDGLEKIIDLKNYINSKKHTFFQPLKDIENFRNFNVKKTLVWESGADIAPEYLHDKI